MVIVITASSGIPSDTTGPTSSSPSSSSPEKSPACSAITSKTLGVASRVWETDCVASP